jgi:hypothetical protein
MEASSAGGGRGSKELKRPLLCSQIWDDRLADGHTHGQVENRAPPQNPIVSRTR